MTLSYLARESERLERERIARLLETLIYVLGWAIAREQAAR